jgi:hypothetical protein
MIDIVVKCDKCGKEIDSAWDIEPHEAEEYLEMNAICSKCSLPENLPENCVKPNILASFVLGVDIDGKKWAVDGYCAYQHKFWVKEIQAAKKYAQEKEFEFEGVNLPNLAEFLPSKDAKLDALSPITSEGDIQRFKTTTKITVCLRKEYLHSEIKQSVFKQVSKLPKSPVYIYQGKELIGMVMPFLERKT